MTQNPPSSAPSGRMTLSPDKPPVPLYTDVRDSTLHEYCRTYGMSYNSHDVPVMSYYPRR